MHEEDGETSGAEGSYERLVTQCGEVEQALQQYKDVVDEGVAMEIRETTASLRDDGEEMLADGRLLRLGVVGQVKAGKSSLLNALLFDGREILPRAATPMTASLTHILMSDRDEVEIEYYGESEWDEIVRHAHEYGEQKARREGTPAARTTGTAEARGGAEMPPPEPAEFLRVSHELVEMAKQRGIEVHGHLGRRDRREVPVEGLNEMLRDLVGAEGELTPLVKSVTVRCGRGIPEFDIVDTPGINDPITSRSREARKLLAGCDAVLMLSYAGQFMDSEDAAFFAKRVPAEGITRQILLASKFDSALVDVSRDHGGDLQIALDGTRNCLVQHAVRALKQVRGDGRGIDVSEEDILFVSPMCASLAGRPNGEWSVAEREVFANLQAAYPDWLDPADGEVNEPTRDTLRTIGNHDAVVECLAAVREDKDRIMEEKVSSFLDKKRGELKEKLRELAVDLQSSRDDLESGAVTDAKERIAALQGVLESIRERVADGWEDLVDEERKRVENAAAKLKSEMREARSEIRDAVSKEVRERPVDKDGILPKVARLFGLGGRRVEPYTVKVEDEAAMRAAVDQLAEEIRDRLAEAVKPSFRGEFRDSAKRRLSRIVSEEMPSELAASALDTDAMVRSIRRAVDRVRRSARESLEPVIAELDEAVETLRRKEHGSTTVLESLFDHPLGPMSDGRGSHQEWAIDAVRALADIANDYVGQLEAKANDVVERAEADLLPAVDDDLKRERKRLEADLENREFRLQRYGLAVDAFEQGARRMEAA